MKNLHRTIAQFSLTKIASTNGFEPYRFATSRFLASSSWGGGGGGGNDDDGDWGKPLAGNSGGESSGWDPASSWSNWAPKLQPDGELDGRHSSNTARSQPRMMADFLSGGGGDNGSDSMLEELKEEIQRGKKFVDGWQSRFQKSCELVKQVREPGVRGAYLKDKEKAEIYRLHKESPEVYTVEKLAKEYGILRQRVHAIVFLKELEVEATKLGRPLDECVEKLLDNFPEFFQSHDQEFHVASLSRKPDFKVMPEDWDGTARDMDEVHFEISQREDEILYQEFVQKLNFIKKKVAGEVFSHKYSRRRPSEGWKFTVEKLGPRGKRGGGGGWKFVSLPDGSSRPLNETEKMFLRRETPRPSRRILAPYRGS